MKIRKITLRKARGRLFGSAGLGRLPNFLIIGAQRSGTSSLYEYLGQHPLVGSAIRKEIHYFDLNFHTKLAWYVAHFPSRLPQFTGKGFRFDTLTGEATPYYLFHPLVPERVAQTLPDVKSIVILRNPVDRAYSHYSHEKRMGREHLSFEEAISSEEERLQGQDDKIRDRSGSYNHRRFSYLSRGIYYDQLIRWCEHFPLARILVLRSEEFFSNTEKVVRQALSFLDLDADLWRAGCSVKSAASYPDMGTDTRASLIKYFRPHNEKPPELLGPHFNWKLS